MDSSKNGMWIIPFIKFGMVRINLFYVLKSNLHQRNKNDKIYEPYTYCIIIKTTRCDHVTLDNVFFFISLQHPKYTESGYVTIVITSV